MDRADFVPASEKEGGQAVDSKPATFTIDDLLAELAYEDVEDGVTARELCEKAGIPKTHTNISRMRVKCNDLVALGKWEYVGQATRYCGVLGGNYRAKAYRPKG